MTAGGQPGRHNTAVAGDWVHIILQVPTNPTQHHKLTCSATTASFMMFWSRVL